jgi:hypothetical protein
MEIYGEGCTSSAKIVAAVVFDPELSRFKLNPFSACTQPAKQSRKVGKIAMASVFAHGRLAERCLCALNTSIRLGVYRQIPCDYPSSHCLLTPKSNAEKNLLQVLSTVCATLPPSSQWHSIAKTRVKPLDAIWRSRIVISYLLSRLRC